MTTVEVPVWLKGNDSDPCSNLERTTSVTISPGQNNGKGGRDPRGRREKDRGRGVSSLSGKVTRLRETDKNDF